MRVLLADNNPDVRSALRLLLRERVGSWDIVEVDNAPDIVWKEEDTCPDLLIVDWDMASTQFATMVRELRLRKRSARVIVLAMNSLVRQQALREGADYFINKAEPPEQLLKALNDVDVRGQRLP